VYRDGVSGTGKSTTSEILNSKGIPSIDIDSIKDLCKWINKDTKNISHWEPGLEVEFFETHEYSCDREQLIDLINSKKSDIVVVFGLADNQSTFLDIFDKVILFHCDENTFIKRINERVNNDFGKHENEQKMILGWYKDFEKEMLGKGAISLNTDRPIEEVVKNLLEIINN
jgi:dephospho-CoA kinase